MSATRVPLIAHIPAEGVALLNLLGIVVCVVGVLVACAVLWPLVRAITKRLAPSDGIRHFGLRDLLLVVSGVTVVIGYNLAVIDGEKRRPVLFVCEAEQAAEALNRSAGEALTLSEITQTPTLCSGHNVFLIPESLSNEEAVAQAEAATQRVRPRPWIRVLRIPASVDGDRTAVESWITAQWVKQDARIENEFRRLDWEQRRKYWEPNEVEETIPYLFVCESEPAAVVLNSLRHDGGSRIAYTLAEIVDSPDVCRDHEVLVIPQQLDDDQILAQAEGSVANLQPRPAVRVFHVADDGDGRTSTVEAWIAEQRDRKAIEVSSSVWRLLRQQYPRYADPRFVDLKHAAVALVPPIAVLVLASLRLVSAYALAISSAAICILALLLPICREVWGFMALPACFVFAPLCTDSREIYLGSAAAIGAAANLFFATAYMAYWKIGGQSNARLNFARLASVVAIGCAVAALYPLTRLSELMPIYMGYGVWIAGLLALAIGSWNTSIADTADSAEGPPEDADVG